MKRINRLILIIIIICCCSFKKQIDKLNNYIDDYYSKFNPLESKLRFDGVYSLLRYEDTLNKESGYYNPFINNYYQNAIAFYNNGLCIKPADHIAYVDSNSLVNYFKNNKENNAIGGVYYVKENKIRLITRTNYNRLGGMLGNEFALFEGDILNRDTIINFTLVPPYPKVRGGFKKFNKYIERSEILVFRKFPQKLELDSTNFIINEHLEIKKR